MAISNTLFCLWNLLWCLGITSCKPCQWESICENIIHSFSKFGSDPQLGLQIRFLTLSGTILASTRILLGTAPLTKRSGILSFPVFFFVSLEMFRVLKQKVYTKSSLHGIAHQPKSLFLHARLLVFSVALTARYTAYEKLDIELRSNNTWRSLACFVTLQLASSNQISHLVWNFYSLRSLYLSFLPICSTSFQPEIQNPYRGIARQAEPKRQYGFSRHKGLSWLAAGLGKLLFKFRKDTRAGTRCDWASLPTPPLMLMTATCQL